jgi:6-phosphogluconolactonase (cycloisomerase 2 family)
LPIAVRNSFAYIGCYTEGTVEQFNVSNPAQMQLQQSIAGIANPQRLAFSGNMLLATGASQGGQVYQLNLDEW